MSYIELTLNIFGFAHRGGKKNIARRCLCCLPAMLFPCMYPYM